MGSGNKREVQSKKAQPKSDDDDLEDKTGSDQEDNEGKKSDTEAEDEGDEEGDSS